MTRTVTYTMTVSLDGYISSPNGDFQWAAPDEALHWHFNRSEEARIDTHLYGRVMWEEMAAYWPYAEDRPDAAEVERDYSRIWKKADKIVASSTLDPVEGARLVRDPAAEIARLKAIPGMGISVGGAKLATSLMNRGLVDEVELYYAPFALGAGRPVFEGLDRQVQLELLGTERFPSGTVLLHYAVR